MYILSVDTRFSAAHLLRDFPGKCAGLHGHNWKVKVDVTCKKLSETGIAIDFEDLRVIVNEVIVKLDHKNLNELEYFSFQNPSSENIARFIYNELVERLPSYISMKSVQVWESDSNSVTYTEEF